MEKDVNSIERKEDVANLTSPAKSSGGNTSGWGGWGFSTLSLLSDLQKAATVAAEEISRNAAAVAKSAAESISDLKDVTEESNPLNKDAGDSDDDEKEKLRKSAIDKLGNAGSDTLLGQGLKVFDHSMENLTSGAWQAIGSAFKGGSDLIQKLEHSAAHIADSIQHGSLPGTAVSAGPSFLETGRALTAKGIEVLELVGKEAMELLVNEPTINQEKKLRITDSFSNDDHLFEDVTFGGCFYIYGGPEQMEELEALSNHHALLYNRRKTKLESEEKSILETRLKQVGRILDIHAELEACVLETAKGKKKETLYEGGSDDEIKSLHDSSLQKAAGLASGFAGTLSGLEANEVVKKTMGRLNTLHSEGVHRVSEMCCYAVSRLLLLGKSLVDGQIDDTAEIRWPQDSIEKAYIIRTKALSMTAYLGAVSNSFITGISDVTQGFEVAAEGAGVDPREVLDRAGDFINQLQADCGTSLSKIQDGLQFVSFLVVSA